MYLRGKCPHYFKCRNYYCVPFAYTCDKKYDCPMGDDEQNCKNRQCTGLFQCKNSVRCLHYYEVSDGKADCIEGDDEHFTNLRACPIYCDCLGNALTCRNITTISWSGDKPFLFISISHSILKPKLLRQFSEVAMLKLRANKLKDFCTQRPALKLFYVRFLDISSNQISSVEKICFHNAVNLAKLNVSFNKIETLPSGLFDRMKQLTQLDISNNKISHLAGGIFDKLHSLKVLNLIQNHEITFSIDVFRFLQLDIILTKDFHICCITQYSEKPTPCSSYVQWPFSCSKLFGTKGLLILVWFFALLIFFSNSISIMLGIYIMKQSNQTTTGGKGYEIIVTFLNICDLITGIHLFVLVLVDLYYGEEYIGYDIEWRKSILCNSLSVVSLFSSIMAMFILGFLSISRILIVKFPMTTRVKRKHIVIKTIICGFLLVSLITAVSSTVNFILSGSTRAIPLCFMYVITGKSFINTLNMILQVIASVTIPSMYAYLIVLLRMTRLKNDELGLVDHDHLSFSVIIQLLLVVISNWVCWIPSCTVLLLSLANQQYPIQLLFWVLLILMPSNSLLNPYLLRLIKTSIITNCLNIIKRKPNHLKLMHSP